MLISWVQRSEKRKPREMSPIDVKLGSSLLDLLSTAPRPFNILSLSLKRSSMPFRTGTRLLRGRTRLCLRRSRLSRMIHLLLCLRRRARFRLA